MIVILLLLLTIGVVCTLRAMVKSPSYKEAWAWSREHGQLDSPAHSEVPQSDGLGE